MSGSTSRFESPTLVADEVPQHFRPPSPSRQAPSKHPAMFSKSTVSMRGRPARPSTKTHKTQACGRVEVGVVWRQTGNSPSCAAFLLALFVAPHITGALAETKQVARLRALRPYRLPLAS